MPSLPTAAALPAGEHEATAWIRPQTGSESFTAHHDLLAPASMAWMLQHVDGTRQEFKVQTLCQWQQYLCDESAWQANWPTVCVSKTAYGRI